MAAGRLLIPGWMPALDEDGNPIPNARVFFYLNKTTTLAAVFSDEAMTVPLVNPVPSNASGRFPAVWADDSVLYSASVDAPYGPAGTPFTYDDLSASMAADILVAGAAEAAADEAQQTLVEIQGIIDAAMQSGGGEAAVAGAISGAAAGTAAAQAVVATKADTDGGNTIADDFRNNIDIIELFSDAVGLKRLGYIGDGNSHDLASVAPGRTLEQWQAIFPPNAISGSLGAVALTDQIDGLAVQRAIDIQYDSGVGEIAITLPPGVGFLTRPIRTNGPTPLSLNAPGGNGTACLTLLFANATDSAWEHGQITPGGPFAMEGVTLKGASSAYAIKITSNSDFSFFLRNNYITGFNGAVDGMNCRSSLATGNVISTFGAPGPRTKDGYRLRQTQPCFQIYIADKQHFGFDAAVRVVNTSAPGIEGVHVVGVQINECNHPFILENTVMSGGIPYDAPDFKLIDCEIETFQSVLGLWGYCQGVDICGNYIITLGSGLVDKGLHLNGSKRVKVKDNKVNIIANRFTRLLDFENTVSCEMTGNDIVDVIIPGKTYTSAFLWLTGTNTGFREYDTTLDASSGLSVGGAQAGLAIEMVARFAVTPPQGIAVSMDQSGRYTYIGLVAGTVSGIGQLIAPLPTRPDGSPLFTSTTLFPRCSPGDQLFLGPGGSASLDQVAPVNPVGNTQIVFQWRSCANGAVATTGLRHVNFEVTGI